jgi:predicted transcriptional regulator
MQANDTGLTPQEPVSRKSSGRRSHLEIRMAILGAIIEGAEGPTQIMYKANLSWVLLCEHLGALADQGFVFERSVGNRKKYSLTKRGDDIIDSYRSLVNDVILAHAAIR